jgi:hypothetical protein
MKRLVLLIAVTTMTAHVSAWAQTSSMSPAHAGSRGASEAATGSTLGTRPGTPGTNSSGTALPSGTTTGQSYGAAKTPSDGALGTGDPEVDRQDRELDRKIKSICKGC